MSRAEATLETTGLTLAESKQVLQALQRSIVDHQVAALLDDQRACPHCGKPRHPKEHGIAPFRTLFGQMAVPNPRWQQCDCQPHPEKTMRPLALLLPERTSPELLYLGTHWAALVSYGLTARLLHEVLPIDQQHTAVTVRNHTLAVARRSEQLLGAEPATLLEGSQAARERLPIPDGPLAVGLDGGIVRARRGTTGAKTPTLFGVIAGKRVRSFRRDDPADVPPSSKCFALVHSIDKKPQRRLFALPRAQGMQANQQVACCSDGGDTVRTLPTYLHPESEHILDWFHLTMRITVLQRCARGLTTASAIATAADATAERGLARRLASAKHDLWHGNSAMALAGLQAVEDALESRGCDEDGAQPPRSDRDAAVRMGKYVRELATYIARNAASIVNYGERYRQGERISTAFTESTINQVVSKRMVKKQQLQWTPEGAHLLLQVRTRVLNDDREGTFRRWYPRFRPVLSPESGTRVAA